MSIAKAFLDGILTEEECSLIEIASIAPSNETTELVAIINRLLERIDDSDANKVTIL